MCSSIEICDKNCELLLQDLWFLDFLLCMLLDSWNNTKVVLNCRGNEQKLKQAVIIPHRSDVTKSVFIS